MENWWVGVKLDTFVWENVKKTDVAFPVEGNHSE